MDDDPSPVTGARIDDWRVVRFGIAGTQTRVGALELAGDDIRGRAPGRRAATAARFVRVLAGASKTRPRAARVPAQFRDWLEAMPSSRARRGA